MKIKATHLYDVKMDPIEHEAALIEIRTIANGYGEERTHLEKIQAIEKIATQWEKFFLDGLRFDKECEYDKKEKFKIDRKEMNKIRKHLKVCRIRTCVVCESMRQDLKQAGKK